MNTTNFSDLKALVSKLTTGEISTAKKFLVAFDSNVTRNKNKAAALFKLLLSKPTIDLEKAKKKISAEVDDRSFDRQITRLREKLLESLLLDINTTKRDVYSDWYINRVQMRKKIVQAYSIMQRGLHKEAMRLFEKTIEKGKEYELYPELVEALTVVQRQLGLRKGKKYYEEYIEQINFYQRCHEAVERGMDWTYKHFIYEVDFQGLNNDRVGMLMEGILDMQNEYEYTKSANVGRHLYSLLQEYYLAQEDFDECIKCGLDLVSLIKESPAIYMPLRLGIAYADLADNELFRFNFEAACNYALRAQASYTNKSGRNFNFAKEIEFRTYFYRGELNSSLKAIDELISETESEVSPFQYNKRAYLKAMVLFLKGEFKQSFFQLQDTRDLEDDKEGWYFGIRLLSIQCLIEMDLLDNAIAQIEALRKHVERYSDVIRKRDLNIYRILRELEKNSFDFNKVYEKSLIQLKEISQNTKEYRWEVKTPEMIVFQDWFMAKKEGKKYTFKLPDSAIAAMESPKKAKPIPKPKPAVAIEETVNQEESTLN